MSVWNPAGPGRVTLLVRDLRVPVVDAATGEPLRDLIIKPDRGYEPAGRRPGPQHK